MKSPFGIRQRLRYRFDNSLSRGIWGVLALLGVLAVAFFLGIAVLLLVTGIGPNGEPMTFNEAVWYALTRSLDPGTVSGDEGLAFRLVMIFVTLVGIFLAAAIIGLVSSSIDGRLDNLRRGRSTIVEHDHTLILGSSDKMIPVISECVEANRSERDLAIVVLTDDDPVEVSHMIRAAVKDFGTSRLVVRSGNMTRLSDLQPCNPATAKSVVILRTQSDAAVVKATLAVLRCLTPQSPTRIVAELEDEQVADALASAAGGRVYTVVAGEIVARISAQVVRSPGLGVVYQELLDFAGDEMYFADVPERWVGCTFGAALLSSSTGTIIGLRTRDGRTSVAPDLEQRLASGDRLIGIAEDDSVFRIDLEPHDWPPPHGVHWIEPVDERERTLVIGLSPLIDVVAGELDRGVGDGSELHILMSSHIESEESLRSRLALDRQELFVHRGDTISRDAIHAAMNTGVFNHVLLLGERDAFEADEADARTMLSLLHVHGHGQSHSAPDNVVAELLDPSSVELAGTSANRDFIVSHRLIALLMMQLSENPHLQPVFDELFDTQGARIMVHPVSQYIEPGRTTFGSVVSAVRDKGVIAIGYRSTSQVGAVGTLANGVRINPPKDAAITLSADDSIVVVVGRSHPGHG